MNSAEFAATIRAKYPQYANVPDDELTQMVVEKYPEYATHVESSVADRARASLASRGLTPEDVKAGALAPMPARYSPIYSGIGEMLGMDDGSGFDTKLAGEGQFWGGAGDAVNPIEIAKNVAGEIRDSVMMPLDTKGGFVPRASPLSMVPDFAGIAVDAYRRGERAESSSEQYGNAVGNLALMAATEGAGRLLKTGPGIARAAEAKYAAVAEPPLSESMTRKMMDRKIVVNDPEALTKTAARAESRANAARDAIPAPKTTELGDPSALARGVQRRTLAQEAQFQADLQEIAANLPERKTVGNVLTKARDMGAAGAVLSAVGAHVPGVVAGTIAGVKLLYEIPKTAAWKTATAIAKRQFGAALAAGDEVTAARIGTGITSGALMADDFGHRDAIRALAAEADGVAPDVRRQVVAAKRGYYTEPNGRPIQIPANVMSAMIDAKEANEATSPVSLWLGAMKKQGNIKGGGRIEFTASASGPKPVQPAPTSERPHWERSGAWETKLLPRARGAEWPLTPLDENYDLLVKSHPQTLLPPQFKAAREVPFMSPLDGTLSMPEDDPNFITYGANAKRFDPSNPDRVGIMIAKSANEAKSIWTHELGHTAYDSDLAPEQQATWAAEHARLLAELPGIAQSAGIARNTPNLAKAITDAAAGRVPAAVIAYADDASHSFAEMFGQYMANPTAFKTTYPQTYEVMKSIFGGQEYVQTGARR